MCVVIIIVRGNYLRRFVHNFDFIKCFKCDLILTELVLFWIWFPVMDNVLLIYFTVM